MKTINLIDFSAGLSFILIHPCLIVRLLGPCFKTGRSRQEKYTCKREMDYVVLPTLINLPSSRYHGLIEWYWLTKVGF